MKRFIFIFGLVIFFSLPQHVSAQATDPFTGEEHIQAIDTVVKIEADGTVYIEEGINYDFGTFERHGIFRDIPYVKTNDAGNRYAMDFLHMSVVDEHAAPYQYTQNFQGDLIHLKIGDPNRTVTGVRKYFIFYTVSGALTYFSDYDELYWNVTGNTWPIPISSASVVINYPADLKPNEMRFACFTGPLGSKVQNCESEITGPRTLRVKITKPLHVNEGLTIIVGFPKHLVSVVEPKEVVPFFSTLAGKITLLVICLMALLWYIVAPILVVWKWWTSGRDPKPAMGEVKAWFSPPKTQTGRDLTPAETGGLIDETVNMRDIYGSIIDLARRRFIKIVETTKGKFTLLKVRQWDATETMPFERTLLSGIFKSGDRVALKDLDLTQTIHEVSTAIYTSLVSDGFFPKNPQTIRTVYIVIAVLSFFTFNPILLLVSLTFGLHMPRKTMFGSQEAAVARSLKNFLVSQDKQLAFQAKNQMMFEKLLPYAIAYGVEVIWAERFKNIAITQPSWYESSTRNRFNAVVFASSLNRGYSNSFSTASSYKSSSGFSSGFSSGGGFSGGGGGGGGGGSW